MASSMRSLRSAHRALQRRHLFAHSAQQAVVSSNSLADRHVEKIYPVNRETASNPELFHRTIIARLREPSKRATNRVRNAGWIPTNLRGRGKIPDILLQIDSKPMLDDYHSHLFCFQTRAKWLLTGPLYELRIEEGAIDEYGDVMDVSHIPFERIRVIAQNIVIHPVKNRPWGFQFTYAPEDTSIRVRIPIYALNEEKAPGIRAGGWLNQLKRNIDVIVEPFVKPPKFSTIDVANLGMGERLTMRDVMFQGKGEGCQTLLPEDTITTKISKI